MDRGFADPHLSSNRRKALPGSVQLEHLGTVTLNTWSSANSSLCASTFKSGSGAS
jgi:hypothetical protein